MLEAPTRAMHATLVEAHDACLPMDPTSDQFDGVGRHKHPHVIPQACVRNPMLKGVTLHSSRLEEGLGKLGVLHGTASGNGGGQNALH